MGGITDGGYLIKKNLPLKVGIFFLVCFFFIQTKVEGFSSLNGVV